MSLEENKAIVRRLIEAYNKQNLDPLDDLIAPDYVDHILQIRGPEGVKQAYSDFYKGFPDTHSTIEDIIAEGYSASLGTASVSSCSIVLARHSIVFPL